MDGDQSLLREKQGVYLPIAVCAGYGLLTLGYLIGFRREIGETECLLLGGYSPRRHREHREIFFSKNREIPILGNPAPGGTFGAEITFRHGYQGFGSSGR
jgi:hypothetical protein